MAIELVNGVSRFSSNRRPYFRIGDNTAVVLSWAFECYERRLITDKDTDGLVFNWGNDNAIIDMMEKLAYRKGFSDFLADGVVEASQELGKGSKKFADLLFFTEMNKFVGEI